MMNYEASEEDHKQHAVWFGEQPSLTIYPRQFQVLVGRGTVDCAGPLDAKDNDQLWISVPQARKAAELTGTVSTDREEAEWCRALAAELGGSAEDLFDVMRDEGREAVIRAAVNGLRSDLEEARRHAAALETEAQALLHRARKGEVRERVKPTPWKDRVRLPPELENSLAQSFAKIRGLRIDEIWGTEERAWVVAEGRLFEVDHRGPSDGWRFAEIEGAR